MNYAALTQSLWITLLGMTIVFSAIVVLWIGMAVLVKLTQELPKEKQKLPATHPVESSQQKQAAAVAVAYALAISKKPDNIEHFQEPPTAFVSAWQAVMRANIFSKRGRVR